MGNERVGFFLSFLGAVFLLLCAPPVHAGGKAVRIVIDVGHSPQTKGAISARNRPEFEFNRVMVAAIARELKRDARLRVFVVQAGDEELSLRQRAEKVNGLKPDLLISVHHDSVQPEYLSDWTYKTTPAQYCDLYRGYSVFVSELNPRPQRSMALAMALGKAARGAGFLPSMHHAEMIRGESRKPVDIDSGVYRYDGLVMLKDVQCAAALVECGVIKNRSEELLLRTRAYRMKFARAVRAGVRQYLGNGGPGVGRAGKSAG